MADLFMKQAEHYAQSRPSYPPELFQFIASKTPNHDLAWDAGTGTGQAAKSLAGIYKNVVATDTSPKQIEFATKLPNVQYKHTPPAMPMAKLENDVAPQSTVDLVTIAAALHWFDLPSFYNQVKHVLKKPQGVIAAWCYNAPVINQHIDSIYKRIDSNVYWHPGRNLVVDKYKSIDFPFEPLDGLHNTGPFEFKTELLMNLDCYIKFIRSTSFYQTATDKGIELLSDDMMEEFERAWNEDGNAQKVVKFPIFLRIGRVGESKLLNE